MNPQSRYPTPSYHALIHALRRRSLDSQHLPTLAASGILHAPTAFHNWDMLAQSILTLTAALRGETLRGEIDKANADRYTHPCSTFLASAAHGSDGSFVGKRPPLWGPVRVKVESVLGMMEKEVVALGRDIEMNQFRLARGDMRAVDEGVLGARREECGRRWWAVVTGLVAEVERGQTGRHGRELEEEERRLRARQGRGGRMLIWGAGKL